MNRALLTICTAILLLLPTGTIAERIPPVMQSVAPVQHLAEDGLQIHCTASSVEDRIWLTAAHCIDTEEQLFVGGKVAFPYAWDERLDVALLIVPYNSKPPLRMPTKQPVVGQRVFMVGFPIGLGPTLTIGNIANNGIEVPDRGKKQLFSISGCGGNSGSPVVDKDGKLISVLQIGFGYPCSPLLGGITFEDLQDFLGKHLR